METHNKDFFDILNKMSKEDYMKNFLTYLLSPVIAGIKPSSTITLTNGVNGLYTIWKKKGNEYLQQVGLDSIELREDDKSLVVLVYNKDSLNKTLLREKNIKFLNSIGYCGEFTLECLLEKLIERYNEFHCPHELGVFLGIPLEDVKAFMECSKSKCIMCGYWKVYGDEEKAAEIFSYYDKSKAIAMKNIMEGVAFNNMVYEIKDKFIFR